MNSQRTAAERRQSVAPGASPGLAFQNDAYPGLTPGATLCRRSAAVHGGASLRGRMQVTD